MDTERRKRIQQRKAKLRGTNTEIVNMLAEEYGFEVEEITPYQLRLTLKNGIWDVFPTSKTVCKVGSNNYEKVKSIDAFIDEIYKPKK